MDKILYDAQKEKLVSLINDENYRPMKISEIAYLMEVPTQDLDTFDEILKEMIKSGQAIATKKGKIMTPAKLNLIYGTFVSHAKGFGFVSSDGMDDDIFIPAPYVGSAMHKDKVLCRITATNRGGKRKEGEIVDVLERGIKTIIGTFEEMKGYGFVVADEKKMAKDIFISAGNTKGAVNGHKVVVKITKAGGSERNPEGKIIDILGHKNDPGVDILSIVMQYDIPHEFPAKVVDEAEALPNSVLPEEISRRRDFRSLMTVTIDGEDTKDIDDAVSLEILPNGNYSLGVHIADVSHYVPENSALLAEAYNRGTSVYLVDRVIPMLPQKLSNGICSLNPDVDRLALSCIMQIDPDGMVVSHEICESVIHSDRKMTYTIVNDMLIDENSQYREEYAEFLEMFKNMEALSATLRKNRIERGAIEFDFAECKIIVDEDGKPIEIKPRYRNVATGVIEEFMLICNETIAEEYFWLELPFVYRTHEEPDSQKIEKLAEFVKGFGYTLKGSKTYTKSIQNLLAKIDNSPEDFIISKTILRSMKQARYTPANVGHFGLSAKYYCHFTSPIRRFPDLEIHSIIKDHLNGRLDTSKIAYLESVLSDICKNCCTTERRAEEAEREVDNLKKVEFMQDKIGQSFDGIISGVTSWGIYVELPNTVEGMVSVNDLDDDYYLFEEESMRFVGESTHKVYRLGDKVKVIAAKADIDTRRIDFVFDDETI